MGVRTVICFEGYIAGLSAFFSQFFGDEIERFRRHFLPQCPTPGRAT